MGLFNSIAQWREERQEKQLAKHRENGTCPECRGSGVYAMASIDYIGLPITNDGCPGCRGTGLFTQWEDHQQQWSVE